MPKLKFYSNENILLLPTTTSYFKYIIKKNYSILQFTNSSLSIKTEIKSPTFT